MNRFANGARITIADVARHAGVSKTTVSHVLSGNRPVAPSTRERVEAAVRALGYRPDGLARSLRTKRSHVVALIMPDITNPFYPVLARGLESSMHDAGYRTLICSTDGEADQELAFLQEVCDRRVDGIVIDSWALSIGEVVTTVGDHVPMVWIGGGEHPGIDTVRADDESAALAATNHLLERGHRRIAMISGPPGAGEGRSVGYHKALADAGLPGGHGYEQPGDWTRAGGAAAMRRLMERDPRPTAVFCANDMMAMGALDVVRELGLSVPTDVALVGFDDIEAAGMVSPPLTTLSNSAYETGRTAGTLLMERATGAYTGPSRTITLPCRLVVRASS